MKRSKANGLVVEQVERKCLKMQSQVKLILERTEDARQQTRNIAAGCPFCNTMMTDGIKKKREKVMSR
jgi:Fe-S oxidoreductase